MNASFSSFVDEMCKIAERSYLDDFTAGVDPTGTRTFQYGMDDAQTGRTSKVRQAIGTAGGLVGGATIVPAIVSGALEGAKGIRAGGLGTGLVRAIKGTYKPFQDLYRAGRGARSLGKAQAGKSISHGERANLRRLSKGTDAEGAVGAATRSNEALQATAAHPQGRRALGKAREHLKSEVTDTGAAIGLSGALGAASAGLQYGKGGKVGKDLPTTPGRK